MTRLGYVIDMKNCIACHACAVACKVENNLPDGIWWARVLTDGGASQETPAGEFPNLTMRNIEVNCQHCDNPACVKACPVGATYKDPDTGAVRQDYDKCIGCRMCIAACPYTGVRSFNWEEPAKYADFGQAMGDADVAQAPEAYRGEVHLLLPAPGPRRAAGLRCRLHRPAPATSATSTTRTPRCPSLLASREYTQLHA